LNRFRIGQKYCFDTIFQIRKISHEIPVILLTNNGSTESARLSKIYGCSCLLQCPIDPAELDRVVVGYLNQGDTYHDHSCKSFTKNETLRNKIAKKPWNPFVAALFWWAF
jgi:DNA-binding NtrC family response regulator